MADEPPLGDTGHPAIPDLAGLVALLRAVDQLRIGLDREIRCRVLLEQLALAGHRLVDPSDAGQWIAPVLASNPREQRIVRERVTARFAERESGSASAGDAEREAPGSAAPSAKAVAGTSQSVIASARRTRTAQSLLIAVMALVAAALLAIAVIVGTGRQAPLSTTASPSGVAPPTAASAAGALPDWLNAPAIALGLAVGAAIVLLLSGVRRRSAERVALAPEAASKKRRDADSSTLTLFDASPVRRALRSLRQFPDLPRRIPDLPASIRASVAAGGIPYLVMYGRLRVPDYLVLIEERSEDEQLRLLHSALLARLAESRVQFEAYSFGADPRQLHRFGHPDAKSELLPRVAARFSASRLILVSDGIRLFDVATNALRPSTRGLLRLSPRIFFTPLDAQHWGRREAAFARGGFALAPLTPEGIKRIAAWLTDAEVHIAFDPRPGQAEDLATRLEREADRWLRETPPVRRAVSQLVSELKRWLGPVAFRLFAASAIHRDPGPAVTVHVAAQFRALGDVIDEAGLARLARLPWMRRGAVPAWLREALVNELPEPFLDAARDAYLGFFIGLAPGAPRFSGGDRRLLSEAVRVREGADAWPRDAVFHRLLGDASTPWRRALVRYAPVALGIVSGVLACLTAASIFAVLESVLAVARRAVGPVGAYLPWFSLAMSAIGIVLTAIVHRGKPVSVGTARIRLGPVSFSVDNRSGWRASPATAMGVASAGVLASLMSTLPTGAARDAFLAVALAALLASLSTLAGRAGTSPLNAKLLLGPAPLGWNFVCMAGLVMTFTMLITSGPVVDLHPKPWRPLNEELLRALAAAVFALAAARMAVRSGVFAPGPAVALAMLFVAGLTLVTVATTVVPLRFFEEFGRQYSLLDSIDSWSIDWVVADVRFAGGLIFAFLVGRRASLSQPITRAALVMLTWAVAVSGLHVYLTATGAAISLRLILAQSPILPVRWLVLWLSTLYAKIIAIQSRVADPAPALDAAKPTRLRFQPVLFGKLAGVAIVSPLLFVGAASVNGTLFPEGNGLRFPAVGRADMVFAFVLACIIGEWVALIPSMRTKPQRDAGAVTLWALTLGACLPLVVCASFASLRETAATAVMAIAGLMAVRYREDARRMIGCVLCAAAGAPYFLNVDNGATTGAGLCLCAMLACEAVGNPALRSRLIANRKTSPVLVGLVFALALASGHGLCIAGFPADFGLDSGLVALLALIGLSRMPLWPFVAALASSGVLLAVAATATATLEARLSVSPSTDIAVGGAVVVAAFRALAEAKPGWAETRSLNGTTQIWQSRASRAMAALPNLTVIMLVAGAALASWMQFTLQLRGATSLVFGLLEAPHLAAIACAVGMSGISRLNFWYGVVMAVIPGIATSVYTRSPLSFTLFDSSLNMTNAAPALMIFSVGAATFLWHLGTRLADAPWLPREEADSATVAFDRPVLPIVQRLITPAAGALLFGIAIIVFPSAMHMVLGETLSEPGSRAASLSRPQGSVPSVSAPDSTGSGSVVSPPPNASNANPGYPSKSGVPQPAASPSVITPSSRAQAQVQQGANSPSFSNNKKQKKSNSPNRPASSAAAASPERPRPAQPVPAPASEGSRNAIAPLPYPSNTFEKSPSQNITPQPAPSLNPDDTTSAVPSDAPEAAGGVTAPTANDSTGNRGQPQEGSISTPEEPRKTGRGKGDSSEGN